MHQAKIELSTSDPCSARPPRLLLGENSLLSESFPDLVRAGGTKRRRLYALASMGHEQQYTICLTLEHFC